jgi:hypothetical protein
MVDSSWSLPMHRKLRQEVRRGRTPAAVEVWFQFGSNKRPQKRCRNRDKQCRIRWLALGDYSPEKAALYRFCSLRRWYGDFGTSTRSLATPLPLSRAAPGTCVQRAASSEEAGMAMTSEPSVPQNVPYGSRPCEPTRVFSILGANASALAKLGASA